MKETGLMFKAPLVRAILAGQKTQTRRPLSGGLDPDRLGETMTKAQWTRVNRELPVAFGVSYFSPLGQPGDRIYARETFWAWGQWETRFSQAKGRDEWHFVDLTLQSGRAHEFDDPLLGKLRRRGQTGPGPTWWKRPSILMPKAATRIWLEVTGVRVERLQDISGADASREGLQYSTEYMGHWCGNGKDWQMDARHAFRDLWIHTGGDWAANPWVWVIDFKRIEKH